ncbi:MAG: 16S rRNA (uracil(1498)-N(3))-methyltransferase [Acetobacter sp.]|nr:16S rRNA (uracil(1498)-N(3))-methyltransferase [Bacteroides sp.]MCM1340357.1 16S rRNA (uracil(1498)-N(3))-methyltransferase [Acetobacter sp.]MCM1432996.1 16S rRNA (uracil(1498)-N(3))-methyltransferase [Clostridiales bacterium]
MQKLFIDFIPENKIILDEEQSRHIAKSLRMKVGDMLMLACGDGFDYGCIIDKITASKVTLSVCYKQANNSEPSVKVSLYQGVPKGDKLEDVIQKCTELGIHDITPVITHRSVSRPDKKAAEKKQIRYQKIALEAAQQSGRGIVPEIRQMTSLKNAVENDNAQLKILFYEGGGESLRNLITKDIQSVSIYIGSEGGFEKSEVELIKANGGKVASLGARILRTQTAPTAALTSIMLLTDNLE